MFCDKGNNAPPYSLFSLFSILYNNIVTSLSYYKYDTLIFKLVYKNKSFLIIFAY